MKVSLASKCSNKRNNLMSSCDLNYLVKNIYTNEGRNNLISNNQIYVIYQNLKLRLTEELEFHFYVSLSRSPFGGGGPVSFYMGVYRQDSEILSLNHTMFSYNLRPHSQLDKKIAVLSKIIHSTDQVPKNDTLL